MVSSFNRVQQPIRLGVLALASVFLAVGCGSSIKPTPIPEGRDPVKIASTDIKAGKSRYADFRPYISDDTLVVATSEGKVTSYQVDTSEASKDWVQNWQVELGGLLSGVTFFDNKVAVVDTDAQVIALDINDGSKVWSSESLTAEITAPGVLALGRLILQTDRGEIIALSASNGEIIWRHSTSPPTLSVRGTAPLASFAATVYVGTGVGDLLALNAADGKETWRQKIGIPQGSSDVDRLVDIDGKPLIAPRGRICAAAYRGSVSCMRRRGGETLWSRDDLGSRHDISLHDDTLLITGQDGVIRALSLQSGASKWEYAGLVRRHPSNPVQVGDKVLVGDFQGIVHALEIDTGSLIALFKSPSGKRVQRLVQLSEKHGGDDSVLAIDERGRISIVRNISEPLLARSERDVLEMEKVAQKRAQSEAKKAERARVRAEKRAAREAAALAKAEQKAAERERKRQEQAEQ